MSDSSLEIRRRQLRFRAWHRGTREADLLLGPFADSYLPTCPAEGVDAFEAVLDEEDPDLWDWVTGQKPNGIPQNIAFTALLKFVAERKAS